MKGLTGLKNLGNTCYINSFVQVIAHDDEMLDILSKKIPEELSQNDENNNNDVNNNEIFVVELYNLSKLIVENFATITPKRFIHHLQHIIRLRPNELDNVHTQMIVLN